MPGLVVELRKTPSYLYRRVILTVAGLIAITLAAVAWMFVSEQFASKAVEILIARNTGQPGLNIALENFSGSVSSGFKIGKISIKRLNPPMQLVASGAVVDVDFSGLLAGGKVSLSASLVDLDVVGMVACPVASATLPDFNHFGCFLALPANIEIAHFSLDHGRIKPWYDFPLSIELKNTGLKPLADSADHFLQTDFNASFRGRPVGQGNFSGRVKQRQKKAEGKLDVCLLGQKIVTEISLAERRGVPEISGYISSATVDIAKISHWLIPLWQDKFPFGFDGMIDCTGSWLISNELGFLGNLTGRCRNLRMVAQGLFISLVELNGSWKYFDSAFNFADEGSRFFGFPASMTGKIESVLHSNRKWELDFNCLTIDFARLADELPWGVKYGMALPPLSGGATLSVQLRGNRPEVAAKLITNDLVAGKKVEARTVSGAISFLLGAEGAGDLAVDMTSCSQHFLPPIFARFKGSDGRLENHVASLNGPYRWQYVLKGSDTAHLMLNGTLSSGENTLIDTQGHWKDGMGDIHLLLDQIKYEAHNIPLLDLILAK